MHFGRRPQFVLNFQTGQKMVLENSDGSGLQPLIGLVKRFHRRHNGETMAQVEGIFFHAAITASPRLIDNTAAQ